jgi:hypothetical protein
VSENCAEREPSYGLAPTRKVHRPLLMGPLVLFPVRAAKDLVAIEAIRCILFELGSQNGNPGLRLEVWYSFWWFSESDFWIEQEQTAHAYFPTNLRC